MLRLKTYDLFGVEQIGLTFSKRSHDPGRMPVNRADRGVGSGEIWITSYLGVS